MEEAEEVRYVNFNQDAGCFACSTSSGFRIYNCDPIKETLRRDLEGGGVAIVEMVFRTNFFALVGGFNFSHNKVIIWDDEQSRCIGELMFRSEVRSVRLRRDRIVVVVEHKIHVYNFDDLSLLHEIETFANRKGICAITYASTLFLLACPGTMGAGEVRVESFTNKSTIFIQAHRSPLACLALSCDGRLLATASIKGTIVRIFSTADGSKLHELRRGAERANILSLCISVNCQWLVLSSDKGTVHVFSLLRSQGPLTFLAKSSLVRGVLPSYLSTDSSFAQFRIPEETNSIVTFGPQKNTILVVSPSGSYYKCAYDPDRGGDMIQTEHTKFT